MQHVRKILQTLKKTDLRIKSDKDEFHVQSVQFFEFIITFQKCKINFKIIKIVIN